MTGLEDMLRSHKSNPMAVNVVPPVEYVVMGRGSRGRQPDLASAALVLFGCKFEPRLPVFGCC